MADVQIDNGNFTQIANVLLEKVSLAKLNGCQYAVILVVWRYTYGFKRKEHELSSGFIAKATGYNKRQVEREIKTLVARNIVFQRVVDGVSRTLMFNKDFDIWDVTPGELADGLQAYGELAVGKEADTPPARKPTVTPGELADQERKSFKQNLKEIYIAHFEEFWNLYPSKKGKAKAQVKWMTLSPNMDFEKVMEGTTAYIKFIEHGKANGKNREYKDGSTYINQESWNDDWTIKNEVAFRPTNKQQPNHLASQPTEQERKELRDAYNKQCERNGVPSAVNS